MHPTRPLAMTTALLLLTVAVALAGQTAGGVGGVLPAPSTLFEPACARVELTPGVLCERWVARDHGFLPGSDPRNQLAHAVDVSPDGGRVFVAGVVEFEAFDFDVGTFAYDAADGTLLWTTEYQGPFGADVPRAIAASPDGLRVFVTGFSQGEGRGHEYLTIAYDAATGAELWVDRLKGPSPYTDQGAAMKVSPDGSLVYVTGRSLTASGTAYEFMTVAYAAADGERVWIARYGTDGVHTVARAIDVSPDGARVYVTGESDVADRSMSLATVAYDGATGAQLWATRSAALAGHHTTEGTSLVASADAVIVTGTSVVSWWEYETADAFTLAYDPSTGEERWRSSYDGPEDSIDLAKGLALSADGSRAFVAVDSRSASGDADYATLAIDTATGALAWTARYDGLAGNDTPSAIALSQNGLVLVTGQSAGPGGTLDFATVVYDAASGADVWSARFQGYTGTVGATTVWPENGAIASVWAPDGASAFVTGASQSPHGDMDMLTIGYQTTAFARPS